MASIALSVERKMADLNIFICLRQVYLMFIINCIFPLLFPQTFLN